MVKAIIKSVIRSKLNFVVTYELYIDEISDGEYTKVFWQDTTIDDIKSAINWHKQELESSIEKAKELEQSLLNIEL